MGMKVMCRQKLNNKIYHGFQLNSKNVYNYFYQKIFYRARGITNDNEEEEINNIDEIEQVNENFKIIMKKCDQTSIRLNQLT